MSRESAAFSAECNAAAQRFIALIRSDFDAAGIDPAAAVVGLISAAMYLSDRIELAGDASGVFEKAVEALREARGDMTIN